MSVITWADFDRAFAAYSRKTMQNFIEARGWYPDHEYRDEWRLDDQWGGYMVKSLADAFDQENEG